MNTNHIATAVEPLRAEAIQAARDYAARLVASTLNKLAEHGYDLEAAYPFPRSTLAKADYQRAQARRSLATMLTLRDMRRTKQFRTRRDPDYRLVSEANVASFYDQAEWDASAQFDEFVAKLTGKVGEHVAAELFGKHVWSYSVVKVTKPDGSIEKWKTQRIINTSSLGKVFNQYPTRKLK